MSSGSTQPFRVVGTATIAPSTTSAQATMPTAGEAVLIYNASTALIFVRFGGDSTVVATSTDMPIPNGATRLIHCGLAATNIAVVSVGASSGNAYVSRGDGSVY